jgi:serine/threonine protein kinase
MGAVYEARQTNLDRLVALKIIRPESTLDRAFAERFNREARTLAITLHVIEIFANQSRLKAELRTFLGRGTPSK